MFRRKYSGLRRFQEHHYHRFLKQLLIDMSVAFITQPIIRLSIRCSGCSFWQLFFFNNTLPTTWYTAGVAALRLGITAIKNLKISSQVLETPLNTPSGLCETKRAIKYLISYLFILVYVPALVPKVYSFNAAFY